MDEVSDIKSRIDIVEFLTQYLTLKKAGVNYSACCPFHNEKTPSFMISPERQTFKCFGCGEGGDVITFFQKIEGLSFPEALKILGERVGVQVKFEKNQDYAKQKATKEKIYDINLLCAKYFKLMLSKPQGKIALDYLLSRDLSQQTIDELKLGFAPADSELQKLLEKKFSFSDLSLAGHPERFRHRLMFPIFDNFSLITGFSGRIIEQGLPSGLSPHPKYLNTPETEVFHKSQAIYGINFAKDAIRKNGRVIIVEGQMDVALAHDAGIKEVVASSGTALTQEHIKILSRLTHNIIFCFDEDEAGQKAANSAVELALEMGLDPKLTIIEGYKDVGELVKDDRAKLKDIFDKALPPVEWIFAKRDKNKEFNVQEKKDFGKRALNFVSRMKDEIEKAHYVSFVSKQLGIPEISIEKVLNNQRMIKRAKDESSDQKKDSIEELFLSFLLNYPEKLKGIALYDLEFKNLDNATIYNKLRVCYNSKEVKTEEIKKELSREQGERLDAVSVVWDEKINKDETIAIEEFFSLKSRLDGQAKEKIKDGFAKDIAEAERSGDIGKVRAIMEKLQEELKK